MKAARRFLRRLTSWMSTASDEARLRAEIEEHVTLQTAENLRAGMPLPEAKRQALLRFGGVEGIKEAYREQKGLPLLETLALDTRHAVRRLKKAPAFVMTTVLTLALGIGATTSIFTLVHAVLLKSLPVTNPSALYRLGRETHCCVWGGYTQYNEFSIFSYDLYKHLRDNTREFEELAAFQAGGSLFGVRRATNHEAARSYPGEYVSGNYFAMLGVHALVGRTINVGDDNRSAPPAVMMSYRLWQEKYGSDASTVGTVIELNNNAFTVVGITPPSFFGATLRETPPDFYVPLAFEPTLQQESSLLEQKNAHWLDVIGRMKPGTDPVQVEAEMRVELQQWVHSHWGDMDENARANAPKQILYLSPGGSGITSMRERYEHWLKILMTVSGFVLLIVCANVANLMLVRGIERRQQTSLSIALGAQTSRLVQQALVESLSLSLLGGLAGLVVAFAGTRLILRLAFQTFPGFAGVPISPSPSTPVLVFAFAVSVLTGIAFGIAPALMAARVDPMEVLRGANRSTSRSGSLPRKALVVFQAALSLVLLCASGLLTTALRHLENQDFGFEQERRTIVSFDAQLAGYRTEQLDALYRRMREAMTGIPGVSAAALCGYSPQSGDSWNDAVFVDGHPLPGPQDDVGSSFERVQGGYIEVIGTPVVSGRSITDQDTDRSQHVAVVNEAFVKKFFHGEEPVGKHFGRSEMEATRLYEIVGVVKDARYLNYNLDQPIRPFFFIPNAQYDVFPKAETTKSDVRSHFMGEIVVVTAPGASLSDADVRRAMASVDPNMPVNLIRTLREQVSSQFTQQRLIARLTSLFGILSILLASIGLYGVTAHNAASRTSEIGVRMALGANRGNVVALVLQGSFALVVVGLLAGLPLAYGAGQLLGSELYGMKPYDPVVTTLSMLALIFSALVAALIPAFRASFISPLKALRAD
jgi:predicted permease